MVQARHALDGASLDTLLREVETDAEYVTAWCDGGYTTNLPLRDLTAGAPGSPTASTERRSRPNTAGRRGCWSHTCTWKSVKWVRGLTLTVADEPRFWETAGYHRVDAHFTLTRQTPPGWRGFDRRVDAEMLAAVGPSAQQRPRIFGVRPDPVRRGDRGRARGARPSPCHRACGALRADLTERFAPA